MIPKILLLSNMLTFKSTISFYLHPIPFSRKKWWNWLRFFVWDSKASCFHLIHLVSIQITFWRLQNLVVRVPDCEAWRSGFNPWPGQIFVCKITMFVLKYWVCNICLSMFIYCLIPVPQAFLISVLGQLVSSVLW